MSTVFKPGDVVKLRSGGPAMTVQVVGDFSAKGFNPGVLCSWFDSSQKKNDDVFHPSAVKIYDPPRSAVAVLE